MKTNAVDADLRSLINKKNYPCIAAVQAFHRGEIIHDEYEDFGTGKSSLRLAQKLLEFKNQQLQNKATYLTYVAAFPNDISQTDEEFEAGLWRELSALYDHPQVVGKWDPDFSDNPEDKNFCISLDGSAFFVVGLYPLSPRESRRLPYNALIFNLYSQFSHLMQKGVYTEMVKLNRQRDVRFQGDVNPMVEQHNETWESIQFSGRLNTSEWRCPFTKGLVSTFSRWMQG